MRAKHRLNDARMIEQYEKRGDLAKVDLRSVLGPGSKVVMKQKQPGKNKLRATGPYTVVRFVGRSGLGVELLGADGKL